MLNLLLILVAVNPAVGRVNVPDGNATWHGTGTLVTQNIVITNWHVVRDRTGQITVAFPNNTVKATVIKTDRLWDLAALRVDCKIKPVQLSEKPPRFGLILTIAGYGSGDYLEQKGRIIGFQSPGQTAPAQIIELSVGARNGDSGGPMLFKGALMGVLFGSRDGKTSGTHVTRIKLFLEGL